jgi:hypothetical protein
VISNFRRVLNFVCFLLDNSPASEFYILHTYLPTKMEQSVPKRRHIKLRRWGITQKKTYNIFYIYIFVCVCVCVILEAVFNSFFLKSNFIVVLKVYIFLPFCGIPAQTTAVSMLIYQGVAEVLLCEILQFSNKEKYLSI